MKSIISTTRHAFMLSATLPALISCAATAIDAEDYEAALARRTPPEIAVPEGEELEFTYLGRGVQIYKCGAAVDGTFAWTLVAPDATLFGRRNKKAGIHYAGPTWEGLDGSKVVGKKVAEHPSDSGSIPWLLLEAASNEGDGRMSNITYIQRLETEGGVAPSGGCSEGNAGEQQEVAYNALYKFFSGAE